jgi:hypothetical protein
VSLRIRLRKLERDLPAPLGPPAAVAVFFDDFEFGSGGKVIATVGEGRPWPPGSTVQPGVPIKWYAGFSPEEV